MSGERHNASPIDSLSNVTGLSGFGGSVRQAHGTLLVISETTKEIPVWFGWESGQRKRYLKSLEQDLASSWMLWLLQPKLGVEVGDVVQAAEL